VNVVRCMSLVKAPKLAAVRQYRESERKNH
jgi:hypothetical protein